MNLRLLPLILALALLWGCAAAPSEEAALPASATTPVCFYDPGSALEAETGGAVKCYPLSGLDAQGILVTDAGFLVLSPTDTCTRLTLLSGEDLLVSAESDPDMILTPEDGTPALCGSGVSFYDSESRKVYVLDAALQETACIPVPEDMTGTPLLSRDGAFLYYCTADAIRVWERSTGVSRVLKQIAYHSQDITGLWMGGTVLECTLTDGDGQKSTLFLSAETGQTLSVCPGTPELILTDDRYYAAVTGGSVTEYLFGTGETDCRALTLPEPVSLLQFLPEQHAAVACSGTRLRYYDLGTGQCTAAADLGVQPMQLFAAPDGRVGILARDDAYGCSTLYLWDPALSPTGDETVYLRAHYTRENPDYEGLAECSLYAQDISRRHGIGVLVYKDAAAVEPWDYRLEAEYRADVLMRELEQLDLRLSHYPEGFLATISEHMEDLTICLVSGITGSAGAGSLDAANGLQFWEGYHAYIALTTGADTEGTLYHELCHLIDTVVLTQSHAYDQWNSLNPTGFRYDNDYTANQSRNSTEYLREEARYFIDMYSMSFPKEDRARIMEYAMTEGNAHYFTSPYMQAKLRQLCTGIRDAFGLKKSGESFLWEQYLEEPLAYGT